MIVPRVSSWDNGIKPIPPFIFSEILNIIHVIIIIVNCHVHYRKCETSVLLKDARAEYFDIVKIAECLVNISMRGDVHGGPREIATRYTQITPIEPKPLVMFSLHQRVRFETIAEPRATSLSPRFHKCSADNDVIIPPRFLSSRSSPSSFYLPPSTRSRSVHVTLPYVLSVSFHPRRTPRRYYAPGISTAALQFPLNRISSADNNETRTRAGRTTKRYFYYALPYYRTTGGTMCTETFTDRGCFNYRSRFLASRRPAPRLRARMECGILTARANEIRCKQPRDATIAASRSTVINDRRDE